MGEILIARTGDAVLTEHLINQMYRLRHEVFFERLKWAVHSHDGMEVDEYDHCNPVYMLVKNGQGVVDGCWRLLPTLGRYMLKDTFTELLCGNEAPSDSRIWELSRFAVSSHNTGHGNGFGFGETPIRMMQAVVAFAQQQGIRRYVTVTTLAIERLMLKQGLNLQRMGLPLKIGKVMAVACSIEIDEITSASLRLGKTALVHIQTAA